MTRRVATEDGDRAWLGRLVVLALALSAVSCASSPTVVELSIAYDDAWGIDSLSITMGTDTEETDASHSLDAWVPDEWAGTPRVIVVEGLVDGSIFASGSVEVTPLSGERVTAEVTLVSSACGDAECVEGETRCDGDAVVTCAPTEDGACLGWSAPESCPDEAPFCSLGSCSADCVDECTAGETACDGSTFRECGQHDADACLDWGSGTTCASADPCVDGTCTASGCESAMRACEAAPPPSCIDASTYRVYDVAGRCDSADGTCDYVYRDIACPSCPECDACAGVECDVAPEPTCADARTRRTYAASGSCDDGACSYPETDEPCDAPPAPRCVDASTLRTFARTGSCAAGVCSYARTDTTCAGGCAGSACRTGWIGDLSTSGAPVPRYAHFAFWTGSRMIIWGGLASGASLGSGGLYDLSTDSWTPMRSVTGPSGCSAVWTGSEMIFWGGYYVYERNTGARYDPATDTWPAVTTTGAPSARTRHGAVWTGTEMIVWGGRGSIARYDGGGYDPSADAWRSVTSVGAPDGMRSPTPLWTGSIMIVWGGRDDAFHVVGTGARYDPVTNRWSPMSTTGAPAARASQAVVWTGSEMIVWGGTDGAAFGDGARYDPATDSWRAMSRSGAPSARTDHTAVWTGSVMIVWGGHDGTTFFDTGAAYDPTTDTWTPLPTAGAPIARASHTAVWTGSEMIVWGGDDAHGIALGDGARYVP